MCRSTAEGYRRCPSHSDPSKVSQRNARRRDLYQAKKNQNNSTEEKGQISITVPEHPKNWGLNELFVDAYVNADCWMLAKALKDVTGWEMVAVGAKEDNAEILSNRAWCHMMVRNKDGLYADVEGLWTKEQVEQRWKNDVSEHDVFQEFSSAPTIDLFAVSEEEWSWLTDDVEQEHEECNPGLTAQFISMKLTAALS